MLVICAVRRATGAMRSRTPDRSAASNTAPAAPIEAASVGVAIPPSIEPSTATIKASGAISETKNFREACQREDDASGGIAGDMIGAILGQQFGAQMQPVAVDRRQRGDRRVAGGVERRQERTLAADRAAGPGMVDRRKQIRRLDVIGAAFDPDRALGRGRQHVVDRDRHADIVASQPRKARRREQRRVGFPGGEL